MSELNRTIQLAGRSASPHDGRTLVVAVSELALALLDDADEKSKVANQHTCATILNIYSQLPSRHCFDLP